MKISEARIVFKRIQKSCRIVIHRHAIETDREKRKFTDDELIDLVRRATSMSEPILPSAKGTGSFLLRVKDDKQKLCEIGIKIIGIAPDEFIIVIHAFRK